VTEPEAVAASPPLKPRIIDVSPPKKPRPKGPRPM
jgi:hypothetical protein